MTCTDTFVFAGFCLPVPISGIFIGIGSTIWIFISEIDVKNNIVIFSEFDR